MSIVASAAILAALASNSSGRRLSICGVILWDILISPFLVFDVDFATHVHLHICGVRASIRSGPLALSPSLRAIVNINSGSLTCQIL